MCIMICSRGGLGKDDHGWTGFIQAVQAMHVGSITPEKKQRNIDESGG